MAKIALGTSSWQFDAWRGVFYPEKMKPADYLAHYARQLPTVEVNTTFYAIPRQSTVQRWVDSVPDGFTFCLKFPRIITHEKRLVDCEMRPGLSWTSSACWATKLRPPFSSFRPVSQARRHGLDLAAIWTGLPKKPAICASRSRSASADLWTPAFAAFLAERGLSLVAGGSRQYAGPVRCLDGSGRMPAMRPISRDPLDRR